MLFHHGGGDYEVAASAAATAARSRMEEKIATGKASAIALYESVHSAVPVDAIVRGRALQFKSGELPGDAPVTVTVGAGPMTVHKHALEQMADKAGVPARYLGDLVTAKETWKWDLASNILDEHFHGETAVRGEDLSQNRHLIRAVGGQVRACLSDKFRRLDSRPLLEAFSGACQDLGGRLADNIEFSNRTYRADTRAQTLALNDIVKGTLGPKNVHQLLATIKAAD